MSVAIIDYGSGNLHSAAKAFERASRSLPRAVSASADTAASLPRPAPASRYSTALSAARRPNTSSSVREFEPSRLAPLMLTQALLLH